MGRTFRREKRTSLVNPSNNPYLNGFQLALLTVRTSDLKRPLRLNMLDQRLNDARKVPEDQPGLRNVMNRVDAEITVQVEGLRREFDSKEGKEVDLDGDKHQDR